MPSLSTSRALALFASLVAVANAAVAPTEPSNAKQVFTAGQKCSFKYDLDKTGVRLAASTFIPCNELTRSSFAGMDVDGRRPHDG